MIKYNYEVSVNENRAKLNKDIFLFRGNRNIHYYFSIKGARFTFSKENEDLLESSNAIYAAVTVVKPNGVEVANAIAPVEDGLIHLKVTEDLIDEEVEVGDFDLVFDLFDDNEGAVTIPKIKGQFHVQERPCTTSIGILSGNVNVVNQAVVDLAIATQENEQLIVVDDDGKYVKTTWAKGDKISVERLNKMEEGIYNNSSRLKNIGTGGSTNASDITITDVNDNFESANVEGALNELGTQYKDIAKKIEQGGTGGGKGLTQTQITALDNMFKICAYTSSDITTQYNEFKSAFGISGENPPSSVTLVSISATCNRVNALVGTLAKDLDITVIAQYSDNSTMEVKDWTTEGTVQLGENTFIITYKDKTATIKINGISASDGSCVFGEIITPTLVDNSYVDSTNGNFVDYKGWQRTDYIGCKGATQIKFIPTSTVYSSSYNAFYDENKQFISNFNITASPDTVDVPTNAVYFVMSEKTGEFSKFTFKCIDTVEIVRGDWVSGKAYKLSLINGAYINNGNGTVSTFEGWATTDYLNCGKASTLEITSSSSTISSSSYNVFYDGNKEFISNFSITTIPCNIEVPTTAQYVRISNKTDDMNNIVITPRE